MNFAERLRPLTTVALSLTLAATIAAPGFSNSESSRAGDGSSRLRVEDVSSEKREVRSGQDEDSSNATDFRAITERGTAQGIIDRWAIPRFVVDQTPGFFNIPPADESTLWAVRNEDNQPIIVDITYTDREGNILQTEVETVAVFEVVTRNLKDVPDLLGPGQDRVEGSIYFAASKLNDPFGNDGRVSIDSFNLDSAGDFANGGAAIDIETACRTWSTRFINFGTGPSTIDILTSANGTGQFDEPTVRIDFYTEPGAFIRSLNVFSDDNSFPINPATYVTENFGTMEFDFGQNASGVVAVRHSAQNRFSVGLNGFCRDTGI